mgnify:CR=1 FL=1|nr:MAG: ribose 5-phosphate isomerase A [Chloroflexota bacterium]
MTQTDEYKRQAAERALDFVRSGMAVGLGSGTTAEIMLRGLAERLRDGRLGDIVGVPTSERTAALARQLGIPLTTLAERPELDVALDGADEIGPGLALIKGLGGALLREKIVAAASRQFIVMADSTKLVSRLGARSPVPVEVIPFGRPLCERKLAGLGASPKLRTSASGEVFRTDQGNEILDCAFRTIDDPAATAAAISAIPGVVGHGLFIGMATAAVVAGPDGVVVLT